MTAEQAHNWLENKQTMMTQNRWAFDSLDIRSNGVAILALEKQISEKQDKHFIENEFGFFCCKETGKPIRYPLVSFTDLEFCPRCGQKIDWSEEK